MFVFSLQDDFATPKMRSLRGFLYIGLGLSAGFPIIHLFLFPNSIKGFDVPPDISLWVYGGVSYIGGALIYAIRFPEKYFKGTFDLLVKLKYFNN